MRRNSSFHSLCFIFILLRKATMSCHTVQNVLSEKRRGNPVAKKLHTLFKHTCLRSTTYLMGQRSPESQCTATTRQSLPSRRSAADTSTGPQLYLCLVYSPCVYNRSAKASTIFFFLFINVCTLANSYNIKELNHQISSVLRLFPVIPTDRSNIYEYWCCSEHE